MATSFILTYKEEIEELKEEKDFEALGDAKYMFHEDVEARLEWAFYRPSGSHPDQVSDPDEMVSIMAFNHSRLGALERFTRLHDNVIMDEKLRVKVKNRSRMLFRAMVDDDFTELVQVLELYPQFGEHAYDQVINGRIWNENFADVKAASRLLEMIEPDEAFKKGISRRLQPLKPLSVDEAKAYLASLSSQAQNLHSYIKEHFVSEYEMWLAKTSLHPLQRIVLQKQIDSLKEIK